MSEPTDIGASALGASVAGVSISGPYRRDRPDRVTSAGPHPGFFMEEDVDPNGARPRITARDGGSRERRMV